MIESVECFIAENNASVDVSNGNDTAEYGVLSMSEYRLDACREREMSSGFVLMFCLTWIPSNPIMYILRVSMSKFEDVSSILHFAILRRC